MLVLGAAFLLIASRLLASWVSGDLDCMEVVRDRQLTRTCLVFSWYEVNDNIRDSNVAGRGIMAAVKTVNPHANTACHWEESFASSMGCGLLLIASQSAQKLKSQNKMKHLRMWIFKCTEPSDLTLACLTLTEVTLAIGQSHVTGTGNTIE
ncbi:hypothetical protein MLD38_003064 [Melastoma candidum]|uniref:Uncharacterized protein n=1 Tax=Melastoma candidum TaxID=119954 RepID=A0ACB9S3C3_9MYRT|nr:hypothetical protein MLD38_003064 [Melastoma candidum]